MAAERQIGEILKTISVLNLLFGVVQNVLVSSMIQGLLEG